MITTESIVTIKSCWNRVTSAQQETAFVYAFYDHLFNEFPAYRDLFPEDLDRMSAKLRETLNQAINGLEHFQYLEASLKQLGQRHQALAITPKMYDDVSRCIIMALETILESGLKDQEKQNWEEAFDLISATMISGYT